MQPVIECDHLTHYYGDKPALRDVSWALRPGRICGLLGRNGAGKTTTINILNSFLTPRSGRCLLLGEDSHRLTPPPRPASATSSRATSSMVFIIYTKSRNFIRNFIQTGTRKYIIT